MQAGKGKKKQIPLTVTKSLPGISQQILFKSHGIIWPPLGKKWLGNKDFDMGAGSARNYGLESATKSSQSPTSKLLGVW